MLRTTLSIVRLRTLDIDASSLDMTRQTVPATHVVFVLPSGPPLLVMLSTIHICLPPYVTDANLLPRLPVYASSLSVPPPQTLTYICLSLPLVTELATLDLSSLPLRLWYAYNRLRHALRHALSLLQHVTRHADISNTSNTSHISDTHDNANIARCLLAASAGTPQMVLVHLCPEVRIGN